MAVCVIGYMYSVSLCQGWWIEGKGWWTSVLGPRAAKGVAIRDRHLSRKSEGYTEIKGYPHPYGPVFVFCSFTESILAQSRYRSHKPLVHIRLQ